MINNKGFTLIEILVALALLGLIVTIIYPTYALSLRITRESKEKSEIYHLVRIGLERMSREINSSYLPPAKKNSNEVEKKPLFVFLGIDGEEEGYPADQLIFTPAIYKWISPARKESEFSEIEYFLSAEVTEDGKRYLLRREDPTPDNDFFSGGSALELGESLKGIDFLYYDQAGEEFNEWDSREKKPGEKLPAAVRITLLFEDQKEELQIFSTLTEINIRR